MGAYTWTYVRTDKLTPQMLHSVIKKAESRAKNSTYGKYQNMSFEEALKNWIGFHNANYDYLVNECGLSQEQMTEEYLTKELKRKMKQHRLKLKCYDKCLKGEMSIDEMLKKTHQIQLGDFMINRRNGHYYVEIPLGCFRNYEYCETEFMTVDSIINHCREQEGKQFMLYEDTEYHTWDQKTEDRVRNFYSEIGDNNFIVTFG